MPEGPEVETVRRTLAPLLVGRTLHRPRVGRKALRTPTTAKALSVVEGRLVRAVSRHGKALFVELDDDVTGLCIRLGMTGRVLVVPADAPLAPHTHVRIDVEEPGGAPRELRYVDPRRFGQVLPYRDPAEREALADGMGPDALTLDDAAWAVVAQALRGTSRALKNVLLDQAVLAGIGNIYAAEILWRARLSPFRAARTLKHDEPTRLRDAVVGVLAEAVERRGTSFSDYVDATGARGDNEAHLAVFQREGEPCPACGRPVSRVVQGQRSTFFCPRCQRVATRTARRAPPRQVGLTSGLR